VDNPQANAPVEQVHQVIHNMICTKDLHNRVFDYIDPWGEILSTIAWAKRASYHSMLGATPVQLVFRRDMIFNIKTIIDWRMITAHEQKQVIKDNLRENKGWIDHQYYAEKRTVSHHTCILQTVLSASRLELLMRVQY
jgi:hypothetical protein